MNIETKYRNTDQSREIFIHELPITEEILEEIVAFLAFLKEHKDIAFILYLEDEHYVDDIPQAILLADSEKGFYMELAYSMAEWDWNHPLLLANDHLREDEAKDVLESILLNCTDQIPLIGTEFGEVSSSVFMKINVKDTCWVND